MDKIMLTQWILFLIIFIPTKTITLWIISKILALDDQRLKTAFIVTLGITVIVVIGNLFNPQRFHLSIVIYLLNILIIILGYFFIKIVYGLDLMKTIVVVLVWSIPDIFLKIIHITYF